METWAGAGVFDANGCSLGTEIWVECKEGVFRKRDKVLISKVRTAQIAWQYLREEAGGRTYLAVMVESDMILLPGNFIKELSVGIPIPKVWAANIPPELLFK